MKIKNIRAGLILLFAIMGFLTPNSVNAQFFQKLKKNVEDKVVGVASEKSDQFLNGETETTVNDNVKTGTATKTTQTGKLVKKEEPSLEDQNVLRFKAPSKDFREVVIQAHNGLPRYGELHFKRGTNTVVTNKAYKALLELKFLEDTFKDMDRSKLTEHQNMAGDLSKKNSEFAQNHLRILAGEILSDDKLKEYFCDSEAKSPCNFYNPSGERIHVSYWGGTRNNAFAQNRSYTTFIKNHYGTLKEWSKSFYKEGSEVAYLVTKATVADKYDFKNKGYWIGNILKIEGNYMLHDSNFLAYTEYEKNLKNAYKKIFLPMDANRAKTYNLMNRSPVFVVFKVRVTPKVSASTQILWEFELESTTVELYKDIALGDKLGEVDIRTVTFKN